MQTVFYFINTYFNIHKTIHFFYREARKKMHPRTPPLHLKFSRRAWDGLIKVWRQRLHFWDPPSEGGGDPTWYVKWFILFFNNCY